MPNDDYCRLYCHRDAFHALGRTEYAEGHRVDALRSVLTIGARTIWAYVVRHASAEHLSPGAGLLDALGQVVATAAALHAHPQTIRYRTGKLRAMFGAVLDDPDARLQLHLALRLRLRRAG